MLEKSLPAVLLGLLMAATTLSGSTPSNNATSTDTTPTDARSASDQIIAAAELTRNNGWEEFAVDIVITNYKGDAVDQVSAYQVLVREAEGDDLPKSLVKFQNPKDRGKLLLTVGDSMWLYLPSTSRPVRVTALQRLSGNASNGDVAQISYADSYHVDVAGEDELNGETTHLLELEANKKSGVYRNIHLWISKATQQPLKAEYRLSSGKIAKVAHFVEYTKSDDGRMLLARQLIIDTLRNEQKTVMEFKNYKATTIPDRMFNKNYLSQL